MRFFKKRPEPEKPKETAEKKVKIVYVDLPQYHEFKEPSFKCPRFGDDIESLQSNCVSAKCPHLKNGQCTNTVQKVTTFELS